ncbi:MAG: hypothetical protein JNK74_08800 [Candidatus Hydrogenedentes bacterium]|nr:hypothetical protein [Candidatus Hydrogenedentota bacterium]
MKIRMGRGWGLWGKGAILILAGFLSARASSEPTSLRLTTYCTVDSARNWLEPAKREAAVTMLREMDISGVIIEVNRGGTALSEDEARLLKEYFAAEGFRVTGGIATVPGGDWGVAANEGLAWMNFQNPKTQADIEASVRGAARVFDTFVVDDFLLSGDTSPESERTRGRRSWGQYRRDLMTSLSQRAIIGPAKEENPDITMIVKFPQSYDRYHQFGYDTNRKPQLYDGVWVGTESRGQYTQRFGFTQPYEGFVNYRWIASLSRGKMGAAWFDFGDCDAFDFVEQAWQTVLAGANDIVLFSVAGIEERHPGLALLQQERAGLERLASAVDEQPVTGVATYKPANSDPGSDMYIMDFVGMLGVPVIPVSAYPAEAASVFVPTYGAHDPAIVKKIEASLRAGKNVVVTTGLLASAAEGESLARRAGLSGVPAISPIRTESVLLDGAAVEVPRGLDLAGRIAPEAADVLLEALVDGQKVPYLTTHAVGAGRLSVLNIQMFTQADFDAVNEVLLSPRNLGMLDMPRPWARTIRNVFQGGGEALVDAPTRVTLQPLGETGWVIQNYNTSPAEIALGGEDFGRLSDGLTGAVLLESGNALNYLIPPRSRVWVRR